MLELFSVVLIIIAWMLIVFKMDKYPIAIFLVPSVMALFIIPLNYLGLLNDAFSVFYWVVVAILFIAAIKNLFGDFFKTIFSGKDREIDYDRGWDS